MARKQVSFRRNGNVVDESPSALSVASEGTAGFLSISQTRMLLSMVDDQSLSTSPGSADGTGSESEIAMPATTTTLSSTVTGTGIPTESDKLLPGGNESQRSSGELGQSKKDLMRSLLAEYGLDDDLSSTGDSLSNKSSNDQVQDHHHNNDNDNDNDNDNKSEEYEIDSHVDSDSDDDSKKTIEKLPAEKSETTCETALDDSDHDHDQESLQLQAGPLQPSSTRQTPKKSIGSPRSRSRSQPSPSPPRNDSSEDRSDPDLEQIDTVQVLKQTSTPKTPASKRQLRTNRHSNHSTSDQEDDFAGSATQPVSTRSAYETDPFASPMSTDSSDFHIRKLDSDIDKELAEAMMEIPPPPHRGNEETSVDWEAQKDHNLRSPPPTTQPKANAAEMSVVRDSDEDSPISISSDEGFLDRAVRRRSNRLSIRRTSTGTTRTSSNGWKVKVPTRKDSFGSKSKTRKSVKKKSLTSNQSSIPVTEPPKIEQMESDDDSSVESPLPEETLRNESLDEFLEVPIEEIPFETTQNQHETLDSDSENDSPIVLIKPRITERQKEAALLSEPLEEPFEQPIEEIPVETKQHEAYDSDSDDDSPIVLIKPGITEEHPELALLCEPLEEFVEEPKEEIPVEAKPLEAHESDSYKGSPIVLIKPAITEQKPELALRSEPLEEFFEEPTVEKPFEEKNHEAHASDRNGDSTIALIKPRITERHTEVEVVELEEVKSISENETKATSTTKKSVLASNEMEMAPKDVKSSTTKRVSKAHDPPGFHGTFEPNDTPKKPKISSTKISKEPPAESTKSQTPAKQTVPQKGELVAKKESNTNLKKPKREKTKEVKATKTTSAVSQETYEDSTMPLKDEIKKLPEKTIKAKKKAKETKTKPKSNVKSKKEKSRVDVKKADPEPDQLPPYELTYKPSHKDDDGSRDPTRSSSMRSIDSDGIWRPPKNIPGLLGSATDLNSPNRSTSSKGSDDLNVTQVEWKSFKVPVMKTERPIVDANQESSRPQTPDITSDRQKHGAKSPAAANQFSTVELNAITLSGNHSEASNGENHGTPGDNKRIGLFMKWPKGNRNESTRRLSNESFEGGDIRSRSTLDKIDNENSELEKTPKAAKSRTFLWPTIPRLPSVDQNLSEATGNTQQPKSIGDTKKMQSPRITAKSLPESYPSMQSPDRQIKEPTDPPLDVTATPKKPKSSSWLPWARKSPKMKHTPPSAENKSKVEAANPEPVKVSSCQDQSRPLSTPFGLPSAQRRPMGRESSVAEQREGRRAAYLMDQQRRQTIKIQAVTRGYLSRKKFPRPRKRAKPQPKVTQVGALDQTREAMIEPSQSLSPKAKSQGEASEQQHRLSSQRNMKPALQTYQQHDNSNAGKSVAEQREARRLAYQQDQQRRGSIVIQSALRGYIIRKKLGLHEPQNKKLNRSKPQDPPESIDQNLTTSESDRNLGAKDDRKHLLVAPKTPDPVTPKKGLRWLPWTKKRDENIVPPLMDKNPSTSELTNVQRFDASLYLRKRMYHDEQENQGKSLDEIRETRRQMYLRDLERREAIKIQSFVRGFLLRKTLSPSSIKLITRRQSKVKSAEKRKSSRSMTRAKGDSEQQINVPDRFDRSGYLRERLERDEAERKTKSVAEVRLERQQIYLRDLKRREATRIQAAWRGHQTRKRYPGFAKTDPRKFKSVNQTGMSPETRGTVISRKTQDEDDKNDENAKQSANWMTRFFFGKSKEAPSDNNLPVQVPVVDEQEPEYEPFDPYADTDDFFGFSDPKYKERTGFFVLDKPKHTYFEVQAVSEDARHWKGRKKQGSKVDFDKGAYLKERKAREEFEKQSATLARKSAARREAVEKDVERRGILRIQAVARGYISRKKSPLPKTKRLKESQNAQEPISQQGSTRLVTNEGSEPPPPPVARITSKRIKKKGKGSSAQQGNRSTSSDVKNAQNEAIPSEKVSTRQVAENSKQRRGTSTKALKKDPSKETSTSIKGRSNGSITGAPKGDENGEKDWEIASDSEILSEQWSEEIIEEVVLEDEENLQGASTSLRNVAPKKLSTQGANVLQVSGESYSKDSVVDSNGTTTSQVGDFDQTDESKPKVHSGSTYSTDVGDSWWLPSIGTEDTRTYREEIYVPDTDLSKYYRRPAPKNSTTTYWEAVRTSYLPSVIDGKVSPVIVPPVVPFSRTSSISTKVDDLGATSSVHSEESWLPPQKGEITSTTIPHGSTDVVEEAEPEGSWVPVPSKPQPNPKRVDFAGNVQKGESFRWAPHLPSPSKRESKPRIERLIGGDLGGETLVCDIQGSVDIEQGTTAAPQNQMTRTSRMKNRRIMTCILFFFVLLAGSGTAAYFLWDNPPWEKWLN